MCVPFYFHRRGPRSAWGPAATGLSLLVLIGGCASVSRQAARSSVDRGETHLAAEELDAALAEFERAIELDPELATAHSGMGRVHRLMGELERATRSFSDALRLDPTRFDDALGLGQVYRQLARFAEAIDALQRARSLEPDHADVWLDLGVCYQQTQRLNDAVTCYRRAMRLEGDQAAVHTNLGAAYDAQGRPYAAIQQYHASLEIDPDQSMVWVNLATTLMKQDRFASARKALAAALERDPTLATAYERLGYCCFRQRDLPEALKHYEWAATLEPDDPHPYAGLGSVMMAIYLRDPVRRDLRKRALAYWHQSLEIEPDQEAIRTLVTKYRLDEPPVIEVAAIAPPDGGPANDDQGSGPNEVRSAVAHVESLTPSGVASPVPPAVGAADEPRPSSPLVEPMTTLAEVAGGSLAVEPPQVVDDDRTAEPVVQNPSESPSAEPVPPPERADPAPEWTTQDWRAWWEGWQTRLGLRVSAGEGIEFESSPADPDERVHPGGGGWAWIQGIGARLGAKGVTWRERLEGEWSAAIRRLTASAIPKQTAERRLPPLLYMMDHGDDAAALFLLGFGADVNVADEQGRTMVHRAAERGRRALLGRLIAAGGRMDERDKDERTPLHAAAERGHAELVEDLVRAGAKVNAPDRLRRTPLHVAAQSGHGRTVGFLMVRALVHAADEAGRTPLHLAAQAGHADVVRLLLKLGANVSGRDAQGRTPLHLAVREGYLEVAANLADRGDLDVADDQGRTAVDLAASRGHHTVLELLANRGARIAPPDATSLEIGRLMLAVDARGGD